MQNQSRIIFTFKVFTEEPGLYIVQCMNVPDVIIPCNNITRCVEVVMAHLDFLWKVEKNSLVHDYSAVKFVEDGWHFQLVYSMEKNNCIDILTGDKGKQGIARSIEVSV